MSHLEQRTRKKGSLYLADSLRHKSPAHVRDVTVGTRHLAWRRATKGARNLKRGICGVSELRGGNLERWTKIRGTDRKGKKLCKKRMRWNCTRRVTRGETRGKTARVPFWTRVSFTPGIFRAFIKKPSIFKVKFHRVTSRVYEPLDWTRALDQKRSQIVLSTIVRLPFRYRHMSSNCKRVPHILS